MKRMLFVYNPHAGKGLLKQKLSEIVDIFVKAGYEVVIYPTQAYRDAYRKITEMTEDYNLVVCSGGDGTIDEVVTGMMEREHKIPVGYIPTGTTNDFANSLKIPKDFLAAADNAVHGSAFPCDIGQFNDDVFVYIAAFGLFTDVSYETKQEIKNVLGHLAYVLEGAKRLFNVPSYKIDQLEADGIGVGCVQITAELVLAVIAERLIPSACGVIIVSSGIADTVRSREVMWQEAAFSCVFKGKLQHFHARKCETVTECFYFRCDYTEILCDDRKILSQCILDS